MIQNIKKQIALWLYPESRRLGDLFEQEIKFNERVMIENKANQERKVALKKELDAIEEQKKRMKLYRNLLNTNIISLQNTDQEIRNDIEQNCYLFITKENSQLMFRHMLSWYVNDSLFDNGESINDEFFRGTINGIQMVRQFMEDQATSHENRQKTQK